MNFRAKNSKKILFKDLNFWNTIIFPPKIFQNYKKCLTRISINIWIFAPKIPKITFQRFELLKTYNFLAKIISKSQKILSINIWIFTPKIQKITFQRFDFLKYYNFPAKNISKSQKNTLHDFQEIFEFSHKNRILP